MEPVDSVDRVDGVDGTDGTDGTDDLDDGIRYVFDPRFAEALLHEPGGHKVLGRRLRPFSLWHRLQLEYANSRLLLGGAGLWDLWCAVQVCCTQYPKRAAWGPWRPLWHAFWWLRYGWRPNWYIRREMGRFVRYVEDYASHPKYWGGKGSSMRRLGEAAAELAAATQDEELAQDARRVLGEAAAMDGGDRDIDDTIEQVGVAMRLGGLRKEEAWNMPAGELSWLNLVLLRGEGAKIPVWTPMHEAMFERNKMVRAEKIAELAQDMAVEYPEEGAELLRKRAAVRYWEEVVRKNQTKV
jgi:hypothetical protein